MPPKKKEPFNPFLSHAKARNTDPPDEVVAEHVKLGEFRDTAVLFAPSIPKAETGLTLRFRCTAKIARGDTITFRLPGFKGPASVVVLEWRPHPNDLNFTSHFQAYWSGEEQPKGAAPAQVIILQCRTAVEENALVVLGIPEAAMVQLPEKLAANSPKLKIEGVVRHAEGGKIPKQSVMECSEIKKRPIEEEIEDIQAAIRDIKATGRLSDEDIQLAQEVTQQEADQIWEAARERSDLKIGMQWRVELAAFRSYEDHAQLAKMFTENSYKASKCGVALALHKEVAANLGVKVGAVVVFEAALVALHGAFYPELSRVAILVARLFTMESGDLLRTFGLTVLPPCIYREVLSAIRSTSPELLAKWTSTIATLQTATGKLTNAPPEAIPVLYRGVKELPTDQLQLLLALKRGDWYLFPAFSIVTAESRHLEEGYPCPDNAALFEIHGAVDGLELGDVSQVPEDQEWLLPMFSSFSVVSVDVLADKNHLTRVVLRMRGSLAGALRDDQFPEVDRSLACVNVRKVTDDAGPLGQRSLHIAKLAHATLRLNERKTLSPLFLLHCQYLAQFAETRRASVARQTVEDTVVKWQQCTAEATIGSDGVMKPAAWEVVNKKYATAIEQFFLRRTRAAKQFAGDGLVALDLALYTVDLGKGPRKIRRMIGKIVTHQPPPLAPASQAAGAAAAAAAPAGKA